jgi:ribosomal protein S4
MYTYKQLKKITYKAKLQSGVFEHNYITIIESKLPSYIYRISLFPTLFESLEFVKSNNV